MADSIQDDHNYQELGAISKVVNRYRSHGLRNVLMILNNRYLKASYLGLLYYKLLYPRRKFTFQNTEHDYFFHTYNHTWQNERAVEIPIIHEIVKNNRGDTLEIGNVLKHYYPDLTHEVLDKYEQSEGVMNEDLLNFNPKKRYDLIISISTYEHIGWDENPKDETSALRAFQKTKELLKPGAKAVITFPIGYSPYIDDVIANDKFVFNDVKYLKRVSHGNKWVESNWDETKDLQYRHPYFNANGLIIATISV